MPNPSIPSSPTPYLVPAVPADSQLVLVASSPMLCCQEEAVVLGLGQGWPVGEDHWVVGTQRAACELRTMLETRGLGAP